MNAPTLRPIDQGSGSLPDCIAEERHVFAPDASRCRCGELERQPLATGEIRDIRLSIGDQLRKGAS